MVLGHHLHPVRGGSLYLVAVMDWASGRVLSWRLSNSLDASFCVKALEEALLRYGKPAIFNTDQGSRFTARPFPASSRRPECRSRWTVGAVAWTTSSSSVRGAR